MKNPLFLCLTPSLLLPNPTRWPACHSELFHFSTSWQSQSYIVMIQLTRFDYFYEFTEVHSNDLREREKARHDQRLRCLGSDPTPCTYSCELTQLNLSENISPSVKWRKWCLYKAAVHKFWAKTRNTVNHSIAFFISHWSSTVHAPGRPISLFKKGLTK